MILKCVTPLGLHEKNTKSVHCIGLWAIYPMATTPLYSAFNLAALINSNDVKAYGYDKVRKLDLLVSL